jgi:hypothetical protein
VGISADRRTTSTDGSHVEPAAPRAAGSVAEAVAHCVMVFAFLPALIVLPDWLYFELTNPLNLREPLVLAFVPVRGLNVLLDSFIGGIVPGLVAGAIDGLLVSAWVRTRGRVATLLQRIMVGATCGALAGCAAILVVILRELWKGKELTSTAVAIAFGIASGALCGTAAAPRAIAFLTAPERARHAPLDHGSVSASQ